MGIASRVADWQRRNGGLPSAFAASPLNAVIARWDGEGLADDTVVGTTTGGPGDARFTTVTASTFAVDTSTGDVRIQGDQQAATAAQLVWDRTIVGTLAAHAVRVYVWLSALPPGNARILAAHDNSNALQWWLDVTAAGVLRLRDAGGTAVDTSAAALPVGAKLRLEVAANGEGAVAVSVFEGDSLTPWDVLAGTGFGTTVEQLRFGNSATSPTWPTLWFAHMAVARSAALIGPLAVPYLDPGLIPANTLHVELYVNEAWTDVSPYVRYSSGVKITRGYKSESSKLNAGECKLTLGNDDGRFSPRLPTGPYYGQIGRNTPLRVYVNQNGVRRYRFYGEVSEWPLSVDTTGDDATIAITASGIVRRLQQNENATKSAMYRANTAPSNVHTKGYWPCEDGKEAAVLASGLPDGSPMAVGGTPKLADYDNWNASSALPTLGTGRFSGAVRPYTATGENTVYMFLFVDDPPAAETTLLRIITTGTARRWDVRMLANSDIRIKAWDSSGAAIPDGSLDDVQIAALDLFGFLMIRMQLVQDGSNVDWTFAFNDFVNTDTISGGLSTTTYADTISGYTIGTVSQVIVGADNAVGNSKVGHIAVTDNTDIFLSAIADGALSQNGENPSTRMQRLATEEGIPFTSITRGTTGNLVTMGDQLPKTFIDLITECGDTDLGMVLESRDQLGLAYRSRLSLYNQAVALALSYDGHDLLETLDPTDDDQATANDITVKREAGSSVRVEQTTGPLSTAPPPDGVGRYDGQKTISLERDDQLPDQAGWRLHLGTVDEPRFDKVTLHLGRAEFADDPAMMTAALALDVGDRVTISGPPSQMPPDDISVMVIGYAEEIDQFEHVIELTTQPESPWRVGVADSAGFDRADSDGSTLATDATSTATSLSVASAGVAWTTDAADLPFDILVGGERMTLTAVTGASSPQTFTVTRSVNGVVKPQTAGTAVNIADPVYVAL